MYINARDRGLAYDLKVLTAKLRRRSFLQSLAGASLVPLVGCSADRTGRNAAASGAAGCSPIPEETAGPFPGDGTIGPSALSLSGIVRSDIRSSVGDLTGTAEGVPLIVQLTVVSSTSHCATLAGHAVYVWQCDRDGLYSMYTLPEQNYLRGVQETADDGTATFTTIFPACYPGRWPHLHFEVYPSLEATLDAANRLATSQLALPKHACDEVFATEGYESSVVRLSQLSLSSDGVFSDGASLQVASTTGSLAAGYVASLTVAID